MIKTLTAVAVALAAAGAASAATVSFEAGVPSGAANPLATSTTGVVSQNVTGSITNKRRSPFQSGVWNIDRRQVRTSFDNAAAQFFLRFLPGVGKRNRVSFEAVTTADNIYPCGQVTGRADFDG